ncbi:MAG: T9SS type A sorting domain-containing protein [Psychroserpens sp.]|uniref:T9SS type A sorting domain-containing protein n=1 Tax=Psychroserpens sp. TaxID=2020870 RepID=UPI003003540D
MNNKIFIIVIFLFTSHANAQYQGGSDDGSDWSVLNGSRLSGEIASVSVLYQGSSGDGFDVTNNQLTLSNTPFDIYNGRYGDGFTQKIEALTLLGVQINNLYYGSSGDGFSQNNYQTVLNGQDLAILFSGNSGDGADNELIIGLLFQGFISDLFKGGIGDGFAVDFFTADFTLDIVEQLIKMDVLLYPNPASQIVNIKPNDGIIISSVDLYNISGQKIRIELSSNNSLNVSSLADGIYLLNIFSDNGSVTKRLIIKK